MGCWAVDTGVVREMGRSDVSSSPFRPVAGQRMRCGPRGRSLEVVGLQCSRKTSKNKIKLYIVLKLDLNIDL